MFGWWMRSTTRIRPWAVAVTLLAGGATLGCPTVVYGPAPVYGPPPPPGDCQADAECELNNGPGWYCQKPGDAPDPATAWGFCSPPPAEPPP